MDSKPEVEKIRLAALNCTKLFPPPIPLDVRLGCSTIGSIIFQRLHTYATRLPIRELQ
jgi:hypothetical protein